MGLRDPDWRPLSNRMEYGGSFRRRINHTVCIQTNNEAALVYPDITVVNVGYSESNSYIKDLFFILHLQVK